MIGDYYEECTRPSAGRTLDDSRRSARRIADASDGLTEQLDGLRRAAGYSEADIALTPGNYGIDSSLWQQLDQDFLGGRKRCIRPRER